jgi:hypothetical protein
MSRRSWRRAIAALLVASACILAVPPAKAATAETLDSMMIPVKLWHLALGWLRGLWPASPLGPGSNDRHQPALDKFGAGHSSDGRAVQLTTF